MPVLIGSYADQISIYDKAFKPLGPPMPASAPSFLAARSSMVYCVGEADDGSVSAFQLDGSALRLVNTLPTGGAATCHLTLSTDGSFLLAANYGSGSVAVFALRPDGGLDRRTDLVEHAGSSVDPDRQAGPHVHQVTVRDHRVHAVDLGMDAIVHYRLTAQGTLEHVRTTTVQPLGSGPRHLVFHPSGKVFVTNELSSTVATFTSGFELLDVQPSILVQPAGDNFPSELALSADSQHLYVANRGNDTITTFLVEDTGLLPIDEVSTGGTWPRHFTIAGGTLLVANERSDTVTALDLNPRRGTPHPAQVVLEHRSPTMVLPLPD